MRPCEIGFVALACVLLGCSGSGDLPDGGGRESDAAAADESRTIALPQFEVTPAPDVPHCACQGPSSVSLGGPESVSCQASSSYCSECPVPFQGPSPCVTVGLQCDYPETWCNCVAVDGGVAIWSCDAYL
jgi:hypothetical protein